MAANQNVTQLTQQTGSAAVSSLFYAVTGGSLDTGLPLSVLFNNPAFTGIPTVPTAVPGVNTTQIASTAYVVASFAPLASPALTGVPTAPTAAAGTSTTQISTTAFVQASFAAPPAIGNTTPNTGAFTTLNSTGLATLSSVSTSSATITGGTINSTPVGATTPNSGSFTTLAASSSVSGAGFTNYLAAPPAIGGTTANTGKFTTLQATSTITPSTTSGIIGTTLGDNANAGSVGEFVTITTGPLSISASVATNVSSISLTAGDWDVSGTIQSVPAGTTTTSSFLIGVSSVSGTFAGLGSSAQVSPASIAGAQTILPTPTFRFNLTTTTTIYLIADLNFAVSTMQVNGYLRARRVR